MFDTNKNKVPLDIEYNNSSDNIISRDLQKVIFSQILLLTTELSNENFQQKYSEITALLKGSVSLNIKYLRYLIGLLSIDIESSTVNTNSIAFIVLQTQLKSITNSALIDSFHQCLLDNPIFKFITIKDFLDYFDLDIFEKVFIALSLTNEKNISRDQFEFVQDLVPSLVEFFDKNFIDNVSDEKLAKFLTFFLKSDCFTLYHRLIIFAKITSTKPFDQKSLLYPVTINFLYLLETMSAHRIFSEINPSELAPSDMLRAVLAFQENQKLTDAVLYLLVEVLAPTSQSLNGSEHTALTSPDIVQSTAKGSSLEQIFSQLTISWEAVIDQLVSSSLQDHHKITTASLSQFFSSLPTESHGLNVPDYFLTKLTKSTSLSSLQEQVIINLHGLKNYINNGGVNIFKLGLEPVVNNVTNLRESIIFFLNIAKLEIKTIANLQKEHKQVSNTLTTQFHEDFSGSPDYLAVGAASLLEEETIENEDPNIAQIAENLIVPLLDINSIFLPIIFQKLSSYNTDKMIHICRLYLESNGASAASKIVKVVPLEKMETLMNSMKSSDSFIVVALAAGKAGWTKVADYLTSTVKSYDDRNAAGFIESFLTILTAEVDFSLDPTYLDRIPLPLAYDLMTLFDNEEISPLMGRFKALESYNELQVKFLQAFPRLSNYGFGHDAAILRAEENSRSFPPEIELKMKNFFEQMYSRRYEIKDITDLLAKLKSSDSPQDQDLFACMLHSIIDEYRFYPTYPTEAIALTSVLFGSLVFFRLFEGTTLKIALRYILESARMPPESNMFKFAVQALFASRARLSEYKSYCAALASIENLKSHKALYNDISAIADGTYTATSSSTPLPLKATISDAKDIVSKYNSVYISNAIPKNVTQESPSEEVSEAISFLLNNLSENNFQSTISDLKEKVSEYFFEYFSNILVSQRAKLEPNYHNLYFKIVQSFDNKLFDEHLVATTLTQTVAILNKDEPSDTERQHLKNLGSWLGLITLKRNKPIQDKNILFELLLVEAYDIKKLAIVLPFVSKVVAATKDSPIFEYPNPWIYGIVQVLLELYNFGGLSLNLKFEIEVLCNLLKIDLMEIEPSTIIRNHPESYVADLRSDINNGRLEAKQALFSPPSQVQDDPQFTLPQQAAPLSNAFDISSAFEAVVSQSHNPIFLQSDNIKNLFQFALTRAIKESLPTIVERINAIAVHSSRNLVLKDFALDPDESKLFNSAHQLLTNLIENLAPVQSRDTLKQSILIVVRATLGNEFTVAEDQLTLAAEEITPIGVELIKTTALKTAIADLERFLTPNYLSRRSYRGSPQQFVDVNVASRYAIGLPEPLGLKAGGVTSQQYSVYENFGRQSLAISRNNQLLLQQQILQQQRAPGAFDQQFDDQQLQQSSAIPNTPVQSIAQLQTPLVDPLQQIQQQQFNQPQVLETMLEQTLDKILKSTIESPLTSIEEVTDDSSIRLHIAQVLAFCLRTPQKDAALLTLAQLVVQALFTLCEKKLTCEVFVSLLESACAFSPSALYDVSHWFVQVYDDRKFNKDVIICLLKSGGLITSTELDTSLSSYVLQKNDSATKFAITLLWEVINSDSINLLRSEFIGIIAALKTNDSPEVKKLISKMNEIKETENISSEEQFGHIFAQWVKICQHDVLPDAGKIRKIFIKQLLDTNILSERETFVQFLRMAIDVSVVAFNKENESKQAKVDFYLSTDAFADLVMEIIINIEDDDKFTQRGVLLDLILSVLVSYFANDHKNVDTFNQRPYFRIFSSLLSNFSEYVISNQHYVDFQKKFYSVIGDKLIAMQPLAFPGFTFAWITLISHRLFLPNILGLPEKSGWLKFVTLLNALLNFQSTYVIGKQVPDMLVLVYKGTLRIMLLLLHDFPELLVENHYQLTVNIPSSFVQLRNVVLSAFPKDMSFPDPFQPGLKIERIPEITEAPKISYSPAIDLEHGSQKSLRKNIDNYMRVPSKPILKNIISALTLLEPKAEGGIGFTKTKYNLKLVNALVLYIGMVAVNEKQSSFTTNSDECVFLRDLMLESPIELQYQLFEAITNQLRFPNAHTHWFSCVIIYFFSSQSLWGLERENVQQVITRVLLERTIANRPHPWGLLITFTELLKNSEYAFFDLPFTKSAPELQTLFGSLLRHISNSGTTVNTPTA